MYFLQTYPPAETRIKTSSFLYALIGKNDHFEKELCSQLQTEACILANSGRALMTLLLCALKSADTRNRNEVLIPAYTCYSVAASVARAGLRISLYDLDPRTIRPDRAALNKAAGNKTLAIIYQHLFGIPQPREDFQEIAVRDGIPLIEDAAQGLGGSLNGVSLGSMGDYSILSFGRGKPLPLGTGGAVTGKKDILESLPYLNNGKGYVRLMATLAIQVLSHPLLYGLMEKLPLGLGKTVFAPGFDISGMPVTMKKLGLRSFPFLENLNNHRRTIADVYKFNLHRFRMILEPEGARPVYTRFPFLADSKNIARELFRLGVRRMYPATLTAETSIRRYLAHPDQKVPGAHQIARNIITLPTHSRITPSIAEEISTILKEEYPC